MTKQREAQSFEDEKRAARRQVVKAASRFRDAIHASGLTFDDLDRYCEAQGYTLLKDLTEERRGIFVKWLEGNGAATVRAWLDSEGGSDE